MKLTKPVQHALDLTALGIPAAEEIIEDALNELGYSQDPGLTRAIQFLCPPGYQAIVELCGENGRSKRRTALADSWSPEEDEIRIYFERSDESLPAPRSVRTAKPAPASAPAPAPAASLDDEDSQLSLLPVDMDARIHELCLSLAEAERGGHAFIALKWFRDSFLPRKTYRWNQNPETRQAVLAEAIQRGVVMTSKIANPKTPAYPTTTIRLNRAEAGIADDAQRFHPVSLQGEPLADTVEADRGNE
jgi:hypothetical protein